MNSLRTCAAVLVVAVSSMLVGCVAEGTVDQQEQDQTSSGTSSTTFGATVSTTTAKANDGHQAASAGRIPLQSQEAVIDPLGNP